MDEWSLIGQNPRPCSWNNDRSRCYPYHESIVAGQPFPDDLHYFFPNDDHTWGFSKYVLSDDGWPMQRIVFMLEIHSEQQVEYYLNYNKVQRNILYLKFDQTFSTIGHHAGVVIGRHLYHISVPSSDLLLANYMKGEYDIVKGRNIVKEVRGHTTFSDEDIDSIAQKIVKTVKFNIFFHNCQDFANILGAEVGAEMSGGDWIYQRTFSFWFVHYLTRFYAFGASAVLFLVLMLMLRYIWE